MKRGRKAMSAAERRAFEEFREIVLAPGGCYLAPHIKHECDGPLDPCHLIKRQKLRFHTLPLPLEQRIAAMWDPRLGIPLCRWLHKRVPPDGFDFTVYLEWLPAQASDAADAWGLAHLLEDAFPAISDRHDSSPFLESATPKTVSGIDR